MTFQVVTALARPIHEAQPEPFLGLAALTGWEMEPTGLVFFTVGVAVIVYALWQALRVLRLRIWGWRAMGVVIEAEQEGPDNGYMATIRFADHSGETHVFEALVGTASNPVGRQVPVFYSPRNPARAEWIAGTGRMIAPFALVLAVGALFVAVGVDGGEGLRALVGL